MGQAKDWIEAIRLRTLPLALASIGMGSFLAAFDGGFRWQVLLLCALTTIFLQILSNLANDYGDTQNGADHAGRSGPSRAVQTGKITLKSMKIAIYIFIGLSLTSGVVLLFVSFRGINLIFLSMLIVGFLAIAAAIKYTMGKNPYGYAGFGDLFVLIFFGFVGVVGTYFCHTGNFSADALLPALSCGLLSTAVLNVNNIRDIESDKQAGKMSIPVRVGREKAVVYHWMLLVLAVLAAVLFVALNYQSPFQYLFLVSTPLSIFNGIKVSKIHDAKMLDPYLKQMALSTLVFILTFGLGNLI